MVAIKPYIELTLSRLSIFILFVGGGGGFIICSIFFQKKKTLRITIRASNSLDPDHVGHLSSLIWVQIVFEGYQKTTKVAIISSFFGNLQI